MTRRRALEVAWEAMEVEREAAADQLRDSDPGTKEHTEAAEELGEIEEAMRVLQAWYSELPEDGQTGGQA